MPVKKMWTVDTKREKGGSLRTLEPNIPFVLYRMARTIAELLVEGDNCYLVTHTCPLPLLSWFFKSHRHPSRRVLKDGERIVIAGNSFIVSKQNVGFSFGMNE